MVRLAAAVGLWDETADSYLVPGNSADADSPGGAGGLARPTAFFNAAFRFAEPMQSAGDVEGVFNDPKWWRDDAQADALAAGDLSPFHAEVDFGKLRRGRTDLMRGEPGGVPASGPMNRILSSRFATGEGADWALECGEPNDCGGQLTGRLQPYAIYVPEGRPPKRGYGLTLLLHSLDANYNQFSGSNNQAQLGERGAGSIVITPAGRGPDGWYYGTAAPLGKVDAVSHGFGRADPEPLATVNGAGTLGPGTFGELPYVERAKDWGPEGATSRRDALTLEVENLRRLRVHPERARLSCEPRLQVDTDGPLTVILAGCDRRLRFG